MPDPTHHRDAHDCTEQLRAALAAHGITLPSLGIDLPSFAGRHHSPPLIALGNCNLLTARALIVALRKGVAR
ncbi:hypothetical protein GCM10020367_45020 [Streptomyces sannanensis]|uniref:Uncharacterized protein n=1 Tax=Streptomyces sannanensis TaxID=285536 RepID=A0ABP6SH38_9ACTN